MKQQISRIVRRVRASKSVSEGLAAFKATGQTPPESYQSLITLHCLTGGRSNDALHEALCKEFPPDTLPSTTGVLGDLAPTDVARVAGEVADKGYYVFPQKLPAETCDRLERFALSTPGRLRPRREGQPETALYDRAKPRAETYMFAEGDSLTSPDIQALAADTSLLAVAQAYLRSQPILDIVAFWWSTAFTQVASDEAAQLYHFDMDRIKWLKFFFYLSDVTTETGPHCYVAGSQKAGAGASELLSRGYVRIPDEDMAKHYPKEAFVEITGPRGTIVAVDTRGFHKGKPLSTGERLLLQLEYADSLFGGAFSRTPLHPQAGTGLAERIAQFPRLYSKYDVTP